MIGTLLGPTSRCASWATPQAVVQQGVLLFSEHLLIFTTWSLGIGSSSSGYLIREYRSVGGQVIFLLMLSLQAVENNGMFRKIRNEAGFLGEAQGFHALENVSVWWSTGVSRPGSAFLEFPWMTEMLALGWYRKARSRVCVYNHLFAWPTSSVFKGNEGT